MASPDFSNYIDLTIYDAQPSDIYARAIEYAQTSLPEWNPAAGSVESAILQAGALMAGEVGGAINRLPNGVIEALLKLFGISRATGTLATGTVTITAIDTAGYSIPAGTRVGYLDSSDPLSPVLYTFDTVSEASIAQGSLTTEVDVEATVALVYPTLLNGQELQLLSQVPYIDSVELSADITVGADPEDDATYLARGIATLNSYTTALVLPSQIQQYVVTTYAEVYRCKVYSRLNPANNLLSDPPENGYVTIYASKLDGASLSAASASTIAEDVANRSTAGLNISVEAPTIINIDVDVTVNMKSGYGSTTVKSNVENALLKYLHPNYWDWSTSIYYNELVSLIDQVDGVDRVISLTLYDPVGGSLSGNDVEFDAYGSLPLVVPNVTIQA